MALARPGLEISFENVLENVIDSHSHLCYIDTMQASAAFLFQSRFFQSRNDRTALAGIAATVLAHVAIIAVALTYAPVRESLRSLAPLMVELIKPELPALPVPKPEPKITLPKPLPPKRVPPQPVPELTILAAQTPVPAAAQTAPPEPKPVPAVIIAEARPAAIVASAPLIPPHFNAGYLVNPAPAYPSLSRRLGEQGRVLLRVLVEPDGLPSSVELRTTSGFERLDQSALDAVRRWKFVPAKQGDKPVAAWVVVPILFNLKGS